MAGGGVRVDVGGRRCPYTLFAKQMLAERVFDGVVVEHPPVLQVLLAPGDDPHREVIGDAPGHGAAAGAHRRRRGRPARGPAGRASSCPGRDRPERGRSDSERNRQGSEDSGNAPDQIRTGDHRLERPTRIIGRSARPANNKTVHGRSDRKLIRGPALRAAPIRSIAVTAGPTTSRLSRTRA
jgi:hypothetical protein